MPMTKLAGPLGILVTSRLKPNSFDFAGKAVETDPMVECSNNARNLAATRVLLARLDYETVTLG